MTIAQNRAASAIRTITHPKRIQKKSRHHKTRQMSANWYKVTSADSGLVYDVNLGLNGGTCTCRWGRHRPEDDHRSGCTHVIAAINHRASQQGRRISVWSKAADAHRQHRPMINIGDGVILTSRVATS